MLFMIIVGGERCFNMSNFRCHRHWKRTEVQMQTQKTEDSLQLYLSDGEIQNTQANKSNRLQANPELNDI